VSRNRRPAAEPALETVTEGGYEVAVGETRVRNEKLDQLFKTALVVSF